MSMKQSVPPVDASGWTYVHAPTQRGLSPEQRTLKKIFIGVAVAVVLILVGVGINSQDTSSAGTGAASKSPDMAMIGNRAVAELGPVLACPQWKDYEQVIQDIVSHDQIGERNDIQQGGCILIQKGDTGLIIEAGFSSVRVRLDKDENAYWTASMFGDPLRPLFVCETGNKCGAND